MPSQAEKDIIAAMLKSVWEHELIPEATYHGTMNKDLIQQSDEVVFQLNLHFTVQVVLAAELHELHSPGLNRRILPQLAPIFQAVPGDFPGVRFVSFYLADGVVAIIVDYLGMDGADEDSLLVKYLGDGLVIRACVLHNDLGFTRQFFQLLRQSNEFAVGMGNFEWRLNHHSEGLHDCHRAFSF